METFSLNGNSSPYGNMFIYVPFDIEVSFAYPIAPNKQEIRIMNEVTILEYSKNNF